MAGEGQAVGEATARAFLAIARPLNSEPSGTPALARGGHLELEEFSFVPPFVLACLVSLHVLSAEVQSLLRLDWAAGWHGWRDAAEDRL